MGHQGSPLTEATSDGWDRPTLVYRPSCPGYFTAEPEPAPSPELDSTDELTPDTCPEGELVFEQSSELDEDVDVGVIETELLFPDDPFVLFKVFGFLFLVWIPSFFMASGRGTPCNFV